LSATNDPLVNRYKLPGVATPILPADITNKAYVDAAVTGGVVERVKTVPQTVNNSTVLVNDTVLVVPILAGRFYKIEFRCFVDSSAVADIKFHVTVPALATGQFGNNSNGVVVDLTGDLTIGGDSPTISIFSASLVVRNPTNAGNIQLQWAQQTAEVSDTIVVRGSNFTLHDLGVV